LATASPLPREDRTLPSFPRILVVSYSYSAAIDAGAGAIDQDQIDAGYSKAGDLVHEQVGYITLADLKDSFIMRSDLTGGGHWLPCPATLDLRTLKRVSGGS